MKAITILMTALAFASLVGCGQQDKNTESKTVETYEKTTTETSEPKEEKPGFFDRFRGEEPIVVKHEDEEASWRWFGWFRGEPTPEPVVEVTVPAEWRWFGWFRTDDEPEEVIVEAPAEKGWFTKR